MLPIRICFDKVATSSYILSMRISAKQAKNKFSELLDRTEAGETVIVTRHGKPVADIVPHVPQKGGIDFAAGKAYLKSLGVENAVSYIAPDFDDPLPEDFLITPMPDQQ